MSPVTSSFIISVFQTFLSPWYLKTWINPRAPGKQKDDLEKNVTIFFYYSFGAPLCGAEILYLDSTYQSSNLLRDSSSEVLESYKY